MATRTIKVKELVKDIRSGMDRSELIGKYEMSDRELSSTLKKLVEAKVLVISELTRVIPGLAGMPGAGLKCPECGVLSPKDFHQCPACGTVVATFDTDKAAVPVAEVSGIPAEQVLPGSRDVPVTAVPSARETGPQRVHSAGHDVAMFRCDPERRGFYETPGVRLIKELKWKFKTSGWVSSSPSVVGGTVFFGSWDGHVYAVNASTGREVWRFKTGGPVSCTPAVAERRGTGGNVRWDVLCPRS